MVAFSQNCQQVLAQLSYRMAALKEELKTLPSSAWWRSGTPTLSVTLACGRGWEAHGVSFDNMDHFSNC
jgi:hypothetical protein